MRPLPRTDTEARSSLPPAAGRSAYSTSSEIGPVATSASRWSCAARTSTSNSSVRRGETAADAGPAAGHEPVGVEVDELEGHRRPEGDRIRLGE